MPSFIIALIGYPLSVLAINAILTYFLSQAVAQLLADNTDLLWQNLQYAAIAGLAGVLFNLIGFLALVHHEAAMTRYIREDAFKSLINKDLAFFVNQKVGGLTSKFIDYIRSQIVIRDLLIMRTLGLGGSIVVGLIIIATQSLLLAGALVVLLIALILEVRWSIRVRKPLRDERRKLRSEIHASVADNLTNSLVVKTFAHEDREEKLLNKMTARFEKIYIKDIGFVGKEGSARLFIMVIIQLSALSLSAWLASQGTIDVATVIFLLTYLQLVAAQIFSVGELLNGYEEALLEASPMTEILDTPTNVNDRPEAINPEKLTPDVVFKDVSFQYGDSAENVLANLNITIPAGQKVGLVGHSGAGKTTVTHLLLRFADVTDGSITIGGHDIRDLTQKSLREHISYVPQEPLLFHRSLRENISYGKLDATDDEIVDAAKKANALEFIQQLPHGLDTLVGERGIKLSGGQRQRIAIARAILKEAPLLILDEATSALDSESEKLIQASLKSLMEGRTSIVIAHRLSTIAQLDRIIVLKDGKLVEDGNHQSLLEQNGIYAKLWNHQSGGFIEE